MNVSFAPKFKAAHLGLLWLLLLPPAVAQETEGDGAASPAEAAPTEEAPPEAGPLGLDATELAGPPAELPTLPTADGPIPGENRPGMVLPEAPSVPPGRLPPYPTDPLGLARARWVQGDVHGTIQALTPWLESKKGPQGRTRTAGHLLLGLAHIEAQNWNLASQNFFMVRRSGGPLAPYGAWHEAHADFLRGRYEVAARECRSYITAWPEGLHADECLLLIGDALSAAGARGGAIGAYQAYLEKHPETPREEEIRLAVALAYARTDPAQGIRMLHELALSHSFPSTDLAITAELKRLAAAGHAVELPTDVRTRMRRAGALRRSGRFAEAWELFLTLADEAGRDPSPLAGAERQQVLDWLNAQEDSFAWGTQNYEVYAKSLAEKYAKSPSGDIAWDIFRAWGREGNWTAALEWAHRAEEKHPGHGRWRGAATEIAWAAIHAGAYEEATERWWELSKRGGDSGRFALFYSAYSAYQAGNHETALTRFDTLLERPGSMAPQGYYWRAKVKEAMKDANGAHADREEARKTDKTGWYSLLLLPDRDKPVDPDWRIRDGRWHGKPPNRIAERKAPETRIALALNPWPGQQPIDRTGENTRSTLLAPASRPGLSQVTWATLQANGEPQPALEPIAATRQVPHAGLELPPSYGACRYWDPAAASRELLAFAERNKTIWPELPAAWDLATAGLYTDAAKIVFAAYEDWLDVATKGVGTDPRRQQIAALKMTAVSWRPYVLFTQDHYHVARTCSGLSVGDATPEEALSILRLGWPVVRPEEIWEYSSRWSVDPWLMLGLMRQESTYRNTALSPVGAIGLIQVMPRTGARVAAMLNEHRYSPGDLEDPSVNLRYGIYYFSKLLDRFDGSFPFAVASYNGGPHNMSRWYHQHEGRIDMDEMVEQIQYDETRDYVRKVSGNYARYVRLYEGGEARVQVPLRPAGDHKEIINF